jgi:hypothetical protein
MARTRISDLSNYFIAKDRFYLYGQFPSYGDALNHCIKENLDIKDIRTVFNVFGGIDFYSIRETAPIEPMFVIMVDGDKDA